MVARLSRSPVQGKPYIISEINESFPNDYAAEAIPLMAAYACLQDWDGFFWHSYTGGHFDWDSIWQHQAITHHLRLGADPMKMSQMAAGALMFLRGDVQVAKRTVERRYPYEWVLDSIRIASEKDQPYWLPYLPGRLALVHRTRIAGFQAASIAPAAGEVELPEERIVSDTGELTWEAAPGDGRLLIDTPRHQCVVMRSGHRSTTNMAVDLETRFASVQLASLDDRPIAQARQLLLVAAARVANTGMRWTDATRTSIDPLAGGATGHPPTRIEPVRAQVTLVGLEDAKSVRLQPLDGCGQHWGEARQARNSGDRYVLTLGEAPGTVWYLLEVLR
jgi:hypothetical protein